MAQTGKVAAGKGPGGRGGQVVVRCMLAVFGVALLAGAVAEAWSAHDERAVAGSFLSSPQCALNTSPAAADDCFAWETQAVSGVFKQKGSTSVTLDGGALDLDYMNVPSWVGGLATGESVPVLVWEGTAQALRDPQGQVLYGQNSALDAGYSSIAGAVVCTAFALLSGTTLLWFTKRAVQRRRLLLVLSAEFATLAVAGIVSGAVIQNADSVATGVQVGVMVFVALGALFTIVAVARRSVLRRRLEQGPAALAR